MHANCDVGLALHRSAAPGSDHVACTNQTRYTLYVAYTSNQMMYVDVHVTDRILAESAGHQPIP